MDLFPIHHHRQGLTRTRKAIAEGVLHIGFIGGSITAPTYSTWPEGVISWFHEKFPGLRLCVDNVALGATGSDLGVFRAQRDLIDKKCDLVFVEYAVNDHGTAREKRRRSQEGLVRKLLAGEGRDVVFAYTYFSEMYAEMAAEIVPQSILDLDEVAAHYGIGSVWMGLHAYNEVRAGQMRWDEWIPDNVHPGERGSWSYSRSVGAYLQRELIDAPNPQPISTGDHRPAPLDASHWENTTIIPFDQVRLNGPWTIRRSLTWWADLMLETSAVGARLSFDFTGSNLCLGFAFGKSSAEFRYRIDDSDWSVSERDRPDWCSFDWFRLHRVAENLPRGQHHIEIEVIHGNRPECTGANFRLALIGVV